MAILWRVSRRVSPGLAARIGSRNTAGANVAQDEFFGLVGPAVLGQASATTSAIGNVSAAATIDTAQAQTFSLSGLSVGQCTIDTAQASTSDAIGNVSSASTGDTAQAATTSATGNVSSAAAGDTAQTSTFDAVVGITNETQYVIPVGWVGAAIATPVQYDKLWRVNPRVTGGMVALLATSAVAADRLFGTVTGYTYADGIGTHTVAGGAARTLSPSGIASAVAFGSPTVYNYSQFVSATGIAAGTFGSASVRNYDSYVLLTGFASESFGSTVVRTSEQDVTLTGFGGESFGTTAVVGARRLLPTGIAAKGFGAASLGNSNRTLALTGWDSQAIGTASVVGPRTLLETGWNSSAYGLTTIGNNGQTARPSGIAAGSVGAVSLANSQRLVVPSGIAADPIFEPVVGFPPFDVYKIESINADGTVDDSFGEPTVTETAVTNTISRAGRISAGFMGAVRLSPVHIRPSSFENSLGLAGGPVTEFGVVFISNKNRTVSARGFSATVYGRASVTYKDRTITAIGWDSSSVFSDFGPIGLDGRAGGVRYGPRTLSPSGFTEAAFGSVSVS